MTKCIIRNMPAKSVLTPHNTLAARSSVFSSHELSRALGSRTAIQRAVAADKLVALGAGYYSTLDLDPAVAQVVVVAKFYPKVVISGVSGLVIHRLSDEMLQKVTVDTPKDRPVQNAIIQSRRVSKSRFIGVERRNYFGHSIRIYDIERLLCDAYRIDRGALFFKALKRCLRDHKPNFQKIIRYDNVLGTKVLPAIQQELADS